MKIVYFVRDDTACSYYRQHIPLNTWKANDPELSLQSYTRHTPLPQMEKFLIDADILHVQRAIEPQMVNLIKHRRELGKYTVLDYDDNLFDLSPLSPHYPDFGTEEIRVQLKNGEVMDLWTHGDNIDIEKNKIKQDTIKKVMGLADLVTVTTPYLASVLKPYARKVIDLPNCINPAVWQMHKLADRDDSVRIYWSGGASHYDDWAMVNKPVKDILDTHKNTKLVLMGQRFQGTLQHMDQSRIEHCDWVHFEAYPYKTVMLQPDIGIIPLQDNQFARGKSTIKWVELAALGIPCVTSYVPPYTMVFEDNVGIFIENNDPDLWFKGLNMLIEDPVLRAKLGGAAQRKVLLEYDINQKWYKWKEAMEGVLK